MQVIKPRELVAELLQHPSSSKDVGAWWVRAGYAVLHDVYLVVSFVP